MNYKETLFFVGKCLTINHEEHNKIIVEKELKSETVNWESVVKLSTSHYVFPALYYNLKKANFLHYLPNDLVEYMKHISDLNRERNEQIIQQAKEINQLLLNNNITPIFLKGTGNLLEGLYDDISERMVGDIDFIVSKNDYLNTIQILKKDLYKSEKEDDITTFKHYPRLIKKNRIAAVEIHKELLIEKYANEFNYNLIRKQIQSLNGYTVMSYTDQLSLSIIAKQINDEGVHYKNIALRNAYDVFLLSKKTIAKNAFSKLNKLQNPLNCFLAICHTTFGEISSLDYNKTEETNKYLRFFYHHLENESQHKIKSKELFFKKRLIIIYKSFFDKEYRNWLIKKITDKNWQREKLVQLGLKKTKPNS